MVCPFTEAHMPDFMLFLHQDLGTGPIRSPEEMQAVTKEYMAWAEKMRSESALQTECKFGVGFRVESRELACSRPSHLSSL